MRNPVLPVLLGLLSLACGVGERGAMAGPEGFEHAIASDSCPGDEQPVTFVYLTPEARELPPRGVTMPNPHIYLSLAGRPDALIAAGRVVMDEGGSWGIHCPDALREVEDRQGRKALAPACDAPSGWVRVDRVEPDGSLVGEVALRAGQENVAGPFRARWVERNFPCD